MGIKVFCDAGSNLYRDILEQKNLDIKVMNMHLTIGDEEYNCYDDPIDIGEFSKTYYERIGNGELTRTTLINPNEWYQAFDEEVKKGNKVICFTMAKGISGTFQSACLAAQEINEHYNDEVAYVIDSMTCGFGEGLQAIHAFELVQKGKSFDEIKKECDAYKLNVRSDFTVDNIKFLLRTGRVGKALAKFANLLNIKVLLKHNDESKIAFAGSVIGRKNSIKKLGKLVLDKIDLKEEQVIYITHCNVYEDALKLKTMLEEGGVKFPIEIYYYDLISGAHIGPGSLAVFYVAKKRKKGEKDEEEE